MKSTLTITIESKYIPVIEMKAIKAGKKRSAYAGYLLTEKLEEIKEKAHKIVKCKTCCSNISEKLIDNCPGCELKMVNNILKEQKKEERKVKKQAKKDQKKQEIDKKRHEFDQKVSVLNQKIDKITYNIKRFRQKGYDKTEKKRYNAFKNDLKQSEKELNRLLKDKKTAK